MAIKWDLAGFFFISAADIEARVIPQLSQSLFRQHCNFISNKPGASTKKKMKACCLQYNASDPVNEQCRNIDSLHAHCTHHYPDTSSSEFEKCMKVASDKEYQMLTSARRNWIKTLERNYVCHLSCASAVRRVCCSHRLPLPTGSTPCG